MAEWQQAAEALLAPHGKVRSFSTCDFGREQNPQCRSVVIVGGGSLVHETAVKSLRALRKALPEEAVAWLGTTRWLGDEKHDGQVELAIGPGKDQFDILRLAK